MSWVVHVCDGGVVWRWCNVDDSVMCVLCVSMLRYVVMVCVIVVLAQWHMHGCDCGGPSNTRSANHRLAVAMGSCMMNRARCVILMVCV